MKKIFLVLILVFGFTQVGQAQEPTPEPKVCISQEAANKCATIAGELIEARKVIQSFLAERGAKDSQIATLTALNQGLKEINELSLDIEKAKDRLLAVKDKIIEAQEKLIDYMLAQLNKKPSTFQKILAVLKRLGDIAIGVGIGSVLR